MSITQNLAFPEPLKLHETWDIVDCSKLNTYCKCRRKFFYRYVLGWEPEAPNHNLIFGSAWHAAMEELLKLGYNRAGIESGYREFLKIYRETFSEATDNDYKFKNPGNALLALSEYSEHFKHDNFEVLYQEISGSIPIDDEGTELYFRLDNILREGKSIVSLEHKTSGWDERLWSVEWALAFQPSAYTHVLFSLFEIEQVFGVKMNGTFFKKGGNNFVRLPVRKTLASMNNWIEELGLYIKDLKEDFKLLSQTKESDVSMSAFRKNPNNCIEYAKYVCEYHSFCTAWNNPLQRCETTPVGFQQKFWDPRALDKTNWEFKDGKLEEKK